MIERIKEKNVWDFLKKDGKPVMIYGMGNGAELAASASIHAATSSFSL